MKANINNATVSSIHISLREHMVAVSGFITAGKTDQLSYLSHTYSFLALNRATKPHTVACEVNSSYLKETSEEFPKAT